jgi:hypothetical protein
MQNLANSGDFIYLFGLSRGAYTIRVLGGFLRLIGLLREVPTSIVVRIRDGRIEEYGDGALRRSFGSNLTPFAFWRIAPRSGG